MIQFRRLFALFLITVCILPCRVGVAQEIRIASSVAVGTGWHMWYETHVDPDNPRNMIFCDSRFNAKENAFKTIVYYSADEGKNWTQAFDDPADSTHGEQSCAYGVHGVAYLVSCATKVVNEEWHHDRGTCRIYVSRNAGKTWNLGTTTGWTDRSTSVVDTQSGPNQNRLYVFFNSPWTFYSSIGNKDAMDSEAKSGGSRVGMISYKDGDTAVAGPFSNDQMAKEGYRGAYPNPAVLLRDGSILTFYSAKRRTMTNEREYLVAVARTDPSRTALEAPVKVGSSLDSPESSSDIECGGYFLNSAGVYDPLHNLLYFAYSDVHNKKCYLFLTTSTDDGKSWSKAQQVQTPDNNADRTYGSLDIAINKDGTLAFMWQDKDRSGCWQFASSADGGKTMAHPQQLGTCSGEATEPSMLNTAYLWTTIRQADLKETSPAAAIGLRNTRNRVDQQHGPIITTPDGAFHVAWIDAGNGDGEIRTAAIQVTPAAALISTAVQGLKDVTTKMVILYGGNQSYDPKDKIVTLDVLIKNNGDEPLRAPMKLAVPRGGDSEFADIANADNSVSGAGAVWDVSSTVPGGTLAPGATTKPFALKFRYLADPDTPHGNDGILGLAVSVYAGR